MFDPSKLHVIVKKTERKAQAPFDIKFNAEKAKFEMSEKFIMDNNLSVNGLTFGKYADGSLILSVQPEEASQFYKKKGGFLKKGKNFKHDVMAKLLVENGVTSGTLNLTVVHSDENAKYFSVGQGEVGEVEVSDDVIEDEVVAESPVATENDSDFL